MAFIVQKFGGTSVADPSARARLLGKVEALRANGDSTVVVVSAMGRKGAPYATDTLLGLLAEAGAGVPDEIASGGLVRDLMASTGETISACLVAALLSARGVKSQPFSAYTAGIRANGPYGDAEVTGVDPGPITAALKAGIVPVVTGFQAVNPSGQIVTIGRGGSDTSAVAIGAYLSADYVDIFTDVPGVAMADPRVIPEAPYLARLDYRSMYRLASNGARVLHDRSALLGERFGTRIRVRSTFDDGEGTLISAEPLGSEAPGLIGIASQKGSNGEATVTAIYRQGTASRYAEVADEAAKAADGTRLGGSDTDALAYICAAEVAPELVRGLYTALKGTSKNLSY